MEILLGGRNSGKTSELIKRAAAEGLVILSRDTNVVKQIARNLQLEIPQPWTYWDYFSEKKCSSKKFAANKFLIDDVSEFLNYFDTRLVQGSIDTDREVKTLGSNNLITDAAVKASYTDLTSFGDIKVCEVPVARSEGMDEFLANYELLTSEDPHTETLHVVVLSVQELSRIYDTHIVNLRGKLGIFIYVYQDDNVIEDRFVNGAVHINVVPTKEDAITNDKLREMSEQALSFFDRKPRHIPEPGDTVKQTELLKTGIEAFDSVTGGLPSSGVLVITGPTCLGKTTLRINLMAMLYIHNQIDVETLSFDHTMRSEFSRLLSGLTGFPFPNIFTGRLTEDEKAFCYEAFHDFIGVPEEKSGSYIVKSIPSTDITDVLQNKAHADSKVLALDEARNLYADFDEDPSYGLSLVLAECSAYAKKNENLVVLVAGRVENFETSLDNVMFWHLTKEVEETSLVIRKVKVRQGNSDFQFALPGKFKIE